MKYLLGSLLLAGICWLGVSTNYPVMPNFNYERMAGSWYPLANIVIELQYPAYTLKVEPKRTLSYSFKFHVNGRCVPKKFKFVEQRGTGKFKTLSPAFVQIVDTDYRTYSISYVERGMDAFLTLAGKQETMTEDLRTKFREYANSVGVTGEILAVVRRVTC